MRVSLVLASLLVGTTLFVGCGSSGGGSDNSSDSTPTTNNDATGNGSSASNSNLQNTSWQPVTDNFTCDPQPMTIQGLTLDARYAASGGISVECITAGTYTYGEYTITDPFEATQIIKVEDTSGVVDGKTFIIKETHDFKAGTIHIVGSGEGHTIDCIETYPTKLPMQINNYQDLEQLLDFSPSKDMLTNTTCPNDYYSDDTDSVNNDDFTNTNWNGYERVNVTVTDSEQKVHKMALENHIGN